MLSDSMMENELLSHGRLNLERTIKIYNDSLKRYCHLTSSKKNRTNFIVPFRYQVCLVIFYHDVFYLKERAHKRYSKQPTHLQTKVQAGEKKQTVYLS